MGNSSSSSKSKKQKTSKQPRNLSPPLQIPQQQQQQQQQQKTKGQLISEKKAIELEDQIAEQQVIEKVQIQQIDVDAKLGEATESLQVNLIPRQDTINLNELPQLLPVVLQIEAIKSQQTHSKANIDLVCVVDVSGSMEGQKIKLVIESLRYIQKILGPNDRIAIVTFGTSSSINLAWTRNKPENKQAIKDAMTGIRIRDSTNIADGVKLGLRMIRDRKYKNPVACMFVLTDGQDDNKGADERCAAAIQEYKIQDSFVINAFGYGNDHDAKVMSNIANLKGGTFTFIEDVKKASEYFIFAMSGMLSVFAKNVKLVVETNPLYNIAKIYGDDFLWKKLGDSKFEMFINYLLEGDKKEFALELELLSKDKIQVQQDQVLRATLTGDIISLETTFQKQQELTLHFSQQQVAFVPKEVVEVNYLRAKAGDKIGQAKEIAKQKKYDQAQQMLNKMMDEIEESLFKDSSALQVVLKDLKEVKEICKPQLFEQQGEALMLNKQRNHVQRQRSLKNIDDWNSDQEEQMDNFKNGNLQLSVCEDMDYQKDADLDSPIHQFQQQRIHSNNSMDSN